MERAPRAHLVKIHAPYFEQLSAGEKTFEIRRNDRDYREGDTVMARECVPLIGGGVGYTGRMLSYRIGHITSYEQKRGVVVWSCHDVEVLS